MFTGIVEEVGHVRRVLPGSRAGELVVEAHTVLEGTRIGDSICTNGVCLTVTRLGADEFAADVMPETLSRSNLGTLKVGDPVDLERAMPAEGRFGGHIVSGHIDGTGTLYQVRPDQNATWLTIRCDPELLRYVVEKGSIAIDGVSLTVAAVTATDFSVSIIPHTGEETVLLGKHAGDVVNLECDIIGKYVERLLTGKPANDSGNSSKITFEFLEANGF